MENLSNIEVSEICHQLGMSYPKSIKQIYGGNIHNSWEIEFKKKKFFGGPLGPYFELFYQII